MEKIYIITVITVRFVSRILKLAEKQYKKTWIEALTVVYCCNKFRPYLFEQKQLYLSTSYIYTRKYKYEGDLLVGHRIIRV